LHASRRACPASNAKCYICDKRGHFAGVCRANAKNNKTDGSRPISAAGTLAAISVSETVLPGANSVVEESRYVVVSRSRPTELGSCGSHSQLNNQKLMYQLTLALLKISLTKNFSFLFMNMALAREVLVFMSVAPELSFILTPAPASRRFHTFIF